MKRTVKILSAVCALVCVLLLAACAGGADKPQDDKVQSSALIGTWVYEDRYEYTFCEDGTGTYIVTGTELKFTYTADDTTLSILYDGNTDPIILDYSFVGDQLNIKDSFGEDTIYSRK